MIRLSLLVFVLFVLAAPAAAVAEPDHPEKAICRVCAEHGGQEGLEKVVAMSEYKGHWYYFCNKKCKETFDADPQGYLPQVFPRPAVALNAVDLDGNPLSLDDYTGQVVLVDFWATWCKPCLDIMPKFQNLQTVFGDDGLQVLGISIDEDEKKVRKFVEKRQLEYQIAVDDHEAPTWAEYGVKAVPTAFLIDRRGQIVARWVGKPDLNEVKQMVEATLATEELTD